MATLAELPIEEQQRLSEDMALAEQPDGNVIEILPEQQPQLDPIFFDYEKATIGINKLISDWWSDVKDSSTRRDQRYANLDIPSLRQSGKILQDETFIANRVIDNNIQKEKTDAMAYLNTGFRLGIFNCISKPEIDTIRLDLEVTAGLTYSGWYQEFERFVDGALLHKYDAVEVVFDPTKPLMVGFEHIGYDNLYFDRGVDDINKSSRVLRRIKVNIATLKRLRDDAAFNPAVIDDIVSKFEETDPSKEFEIFKVFFLVNNCCYVAWWMKDTTIRQWLKDPDKLFLGIYDEVGNEVEIDSYPVFIYIYREDEQQKIVDKKGRAFLDGPEQEATTAVKTGFVNGLVRASNVYGAASSDDGESAEMKQLDVKLKHGCVYNKPITFFRTEYPDISTLGALQYFDSKKSDELGKPTFSVMNRKDARKTSAEIKTANVEDSKATATKLATFSEVLRKILVFSWKIIQSQALQGKITLLLIRKEVPIFEQNPEFGTTVVYENDIETISQTFDIRPAGDTDVIAANEQIQKMQEDWPVFSAYPGLMQVFVSDYIKLRYPKKAQLYIQALIVGDPVRAALASLLTLLQGFISPQEVKQLSPEQLQNVMMHITNAQSLLAPTPTEGQGSQQQKLIA